MVRASLAFLASILLVGLVFVLLATKTVQFAMVLQGYAVVVMLDINPQVLLARSVLQAPFLQEQLHVLHVLIFARPVQR